MKKRFVILLTFIALASPVFGGGNRIDARRPDAPELSRLGEFSIGVRTLRLIHKNQIDALKVQPGKVLPYYDRPLSVEVWYPAHAQDGDGAYDNVFLRDGKTTVTLYGAASRAAKTLRSASSYPLIVLSHGYPGNRYLMSHFGENLASKGYVVAAIDHTDSTYRDAGAFPSTLLNRALDQKFVLDEMARFNTSAGHFLHNMVDSDNAGLIGYSMGGYGAVISAGGGLTRAAAQNQQVSPNEILRQVMSGTQAYDDLIDDRFNAIVAIAPWGMKDGLWDAQSLLGVRTPMFFITGSLDKTSGYESGTRALFTAVQNVDRYLLTFDNGGHSTAAPIPPPRESATAYYRDGSSVFAHYADSVWDAVRANNIAQHFVTAYFASLLKGEAVMTQYLKTGDSPESNSEYNQWKGFSKGNARGITLEYLSRKRHKK